MKNIERFAIITTIISLVSSLITIFGFISGIVVPENISPILTKPLVSFLILIFLAYLVGTLLVLIEIYYNKKVTTQGVRVRDQKRESYLLLSCIITLWLPIIITWCLWAFKHSSGFVQLFIIIVGFIIGTLFITFVSAVISELLNPYADTKVKFTNKFK